jgi:membrane fusion protein (multidrug efflux system)
VRHDVTAANSYGTNWIVTSGLADGDQVMVSGLQSVHEGQAVKASDWQPPAAASAASAASAPPMAGAAGNAQ